MKKIFNKLEKKEDRKSLRSNMTIEEKRLWIHIKGAQLNGRKFRRQYSIENFIVDFYCPSEKLVIEINGKYHEAANVQEYDYQRSLVIQKFGIQILVLKNEDIQHNLEATLEKIKSYFKENEDL